MYARIVHVAILIRDDQTTEVVLDAMNDLRYGYAPLVLDWDFQRSPDVDVQRVLLPDDYREGTTDFTFQAEPAPEPDP